MKLQSIQPQFKGVEVVYRKAFGPTERIPEGAKKPVIQRALTQNEVDLYLKATSKETPIQVIQQEDRTVILDGAKTFQDLQNTTIRLLKNRLELVYTFLKEANKAPNKLVATTKRESALILAKSTSPELDSIALNVFIQEQEKQQAVKTTDLGVAMPVLK